MFNEIVNFCINYFDLPKELEKKVCDVISKLPGLAGAPLKIIQLILKEIPINPREPRGSLSQEEIVEMYMEVNKKLNNNYTIGHLLQPGTEQERNARLGQAILTVKEKSLGLPPHLNVVIPVAIMAIWGYVLYRIINGNPPVEDVRSQERQFYNTLRNAVSRGEWPHRMDELLQLLNNYKEALKAAILSPIVHSESFIEKRELQIELDSLAIIPELFNRNRQNPNFYLDRETVIRYWNDPKIRGQLVKQPQPREEPPAPALEAVNPMLPASEIRTIATAPKDRVTALYFLGNNQLASLLTSTSTAYKTIKIWDVKAGHCLQTIQARDYSILFSLGNEWLGISHSTAGCIDVMNIKTGHLQKRLTLGQYSFPLCSLGNSQLALLETPKSKNIKVWDIMTGQCLQTLIGHSDTVSVLCFLGNGLLASESWDNSIKIWDSTTGQCLQTLKLPNASSFRGAPAPLCYLGNDQLASGSLSLDHSIIIWDIKTGHCLRTLTGHSKSPINLCYLANDFLASGSEDNFKIWDIRTGQCLQTLTGHRGYISSLCALDEGHLASGAQDGIKVWKLKAPQLTKFWNQPANDRPMIDQVFDEAQRMRI